MLICVLKFSFGVGKFKPDILKIMVFFYFFKIGKAFNRNQLIGHEISLGSGWVDITYNKTAYLPCGLRRGKEIAPKKKPVKAFCAGFENHTTKKRPDARNMRGGYTVTVPGTSPEMLYPVVLVD
jgi:hypothetical protein